MLRKSRFSFQKTIMQVSIIKKSDIQEAHRFDAEFFKPEYLEIEERLKKIKSEKFKNYLLEITGGATPLGANYSKQGVPFLRVQNVMYNYINDNDVVFISDKQEAEIKRSRLKEGDVLLTITGSYGKSAPVISQYVGSNINQHSVRMKFKEELRPFYVSTFLNCKYGKKQSDKNIVGISRPALDYEAIKIFLIPIFPQSFQIQIEKIVKFAYEKQIKSKQLHKEAEELLLKELSLLDYKLEHILSFEASKKEIDEAKRFDAEYFQPKYEDIIKRIESHKDGWDYIKNLVNWKKGVEVGSERYQQDGISFGRVSDFSIDGVEKTGKKISEELYQELRKNYQPKRDDILFTKDGTIGLSYVLKEEFEIILSGAFLRLSLKEKYQNFEKECLVLIFNSIICKMQVEKLSGGAIIAHLKPSDFEKFKIPLIKLKIQKEIAEKITKSHKLRKESKELLEEAKRKVEQEIEKG